MAEKACGRLLLLFTRIPKIDRCERPSVILAEAVGGYSSAFESSRRSPILKPVTTQSFCFFLTERRIDMFG